MGKKRRTQLQFPADVVLFHPQNRELAAKGKPFELTNAMNNPWPGIWLVLVFVSAWGGGVLALLFIGVTSILQLFTSDLTPSARTESIIFIVGGAVASIPLGGIFLVLLRVVNGMLKSVRPWRLQNQLVKRGEVVEGRVVAVNPTLKSTHWDVEYDFKPPEGDVQRAVAEFRELDGDAPPQGGERLAVLYLNDEVFTPL